MASSSPWDRFPLWGPWCEPVASRWELQELISQHTLMALWEIPHVIFTFKKKACQYVPLILQRLRQEDSSKFKASWTT